MSVHANHHHHRSEPRRNDNRLTAKQCRDEERLRELVEDCISVNAWPIHSRPLRKLIERRGLDLRATRRFRLSFESLLALMQRMHSASVRVERHLAIDNAFHTTLHNYEVLLRLLLLEWPSDQSVPTKMRHAVDRAYDSFEALEPLLSGLIRQLLDRGVPSWRLARDVLAAGGHDYGHSGDTDRIGPDGTPLPLTHEETAERHVAKFGIAFGFPPSLILESLAGIRATTLHVRQGREKVQASNDFERKMTLADVAGCVMRPDQWMVHVAIPVLQERMLPWQQRYSEISAEIERLKRQLERLPANAAERRRKQERLEQLEAEEVAPIKTVSDAFDNELRFLSFIRQSRLEPVDVGSRLWGERIDRRIALIERLLERRDLLEPLDEHGFPLVETLTERLANAESLQSSLAEDGIDPNLRELFSEFIPASMSA
ncbi:MAG: hypothetical protein AAF560_05545 [Acidobacteriota bacterium]